MGLTRLPPVVLDVVLGEALLEQLPERDLEPVEVAHQAITSSDSASRLAAALVTMAPARAVYPTPAHRQRPPTTAHVPVRVAADVDRPQQQQPAERQRDEDLPAEVHELVVAEARSVARIHTNTNRNTISFTENQTRPHSQSGEHEERQSGGPPKNSATMIADTVIVFMNSAR